jgi:hypothetical protein
MNNLFLINEEEKNRILGMHETATKKHYLSEQPTLDLGQPTQPEVGPQTLQNTTGTVVKKGLGGDPYVYAKLGDDFYYGKASDGDYPNWVLATNPNAINSIKGKIYNEKVPVVNTVKVPVKSKTKVQTKKTTTTPKTTTKQKTTTTVPGKEKFKVTPKTNVRGKDKFKLEPELNTVAIDNTRVGNGREKKITDIKKVLNDLGPSKKSILPLHLRAVWDYMVGRTEPFTSADLTKEEQKYLKQVVLSNPKKGLNYGIWKSNGAGNLPTAMSTGSASEKERLKKSGGSGSLLRPELGGQYMYFLGDVAPSNVKTSPDKKTVVVNDNYDMNNTKLPKDEILKDFAEQVGRFALGDATLYSVIRRTAGLRELTGYKGYPVNLTV